jgi:hypothetical protein
MSTDSDQWIKATKSAETGNCIEMRRHDDAVQVRDTKEHGQGPTLTVTPVAFSAWVTSAKDGQLDHLI